ncbi:U-scoloptoxin(05)-Sm1a isoform X1 [Pararge aegeria]|uniref:Jg3376 protein n=2 Tax=Pararge aegeria TaxID=116150 RepID=A0A8S4RNZ6_9NEOP|nr:U-scoloptoxin(05)-Sm1a isoform X1 [Pararge aegeria]CAH2239945.1 jg3376 [Pararge aegeria aegeria]
MNKLTTKSILFILLGVNTLKTVLSVSCYQCSGTDSNEPFECNEFLDSNSQISHTDCEGIHDAQFCIKHVGRFEGGIGTKRFCSSLDLGNYCNYVQQPGDKLEYRTCIYTCGTDGCNGTVALRISAVNLILALFVAYINGC